MMSKYLFIDGAFLLDLGKRYSQEIFNRDDPMEVFDFNRIVSSYTRAFFYDSLPARNKKHSDAEYECLVKEKERFFHKLNMVPDLRVHSGVSRHRRERNAEQKGVDVLLAIEVYQHAVQGNMNIAT